MVFFNNFVDNFNKNIMTRGTKIALISLGLLAVGVGVYMVVSNKRKKSGNKQKDERKITLKSTTK